jgi:hypothetical protein
MELATFRGAMSAITIADDTFLAIFALISPFPFYPIHTPQTAEISFSIVVTPYIVHVF